ncbi:MAG: two-component system, OmpR family, sensor histidine kinase KdpD [Gaiellaceae bacterium]|jgi:two-component system sensor histidine kinase KdpD|nr:two-component system, OmpR family, sensor histidine kinase KdpD [Gaiellaceae bacterium]
MQIPMRVRSVLLSLGSVALVTGAIYALRPIAPVLSLGVLYLFAVLPAAALLGLRYAVGVSVVSMLTFNFLFLAPRHTFRLADSENWVALAVYLVTAVSVSELAARARRRASEAEKLAREASEAAALRRSDAAKTAVLRSVSHDLRSPITAIMTASDVLESSRADLSADEREELHAAIRLQARRLNRFVSNMLDVSRLEAGAALPAPELWTVDGLIARALEAIGPENERVDAVLPDDSPPVRVDAAQLEHVFVNLLENALKFSSPGDRIELRAESERGEVVVRITDHGPGIPAQERERLFEPFTRGANGDSGGGTGLGLSIARGFTQLNGGRLWIETGPDNGTTLALALPVADLPSIAAT